MIQDYVSYYKCKNINLSKTENEFHFIKKVILIKSKFIWMFLKMYT